MRRLIARINRWLAPAAVANAVDPATSTVQTSSAVGVKIVLGEVEEAGREQQTPEEAQKSDS